MRLFLSAQGIGILSLGVSAGAVSVDEALQINRRLRKLYPMDATAVPEGRSPSRLALCLENDTGTATLCEETFGAVGMVGFYPPLPNTIRSLLYFADYSQEEYEPVLDENMLVYSYAELARSVDQSAIDEFLFLRHRHLAPLHYRVGNNQVLLGVTAHSCSVLRIRESASLALGQPDRASADSPIVSIDEADTRSAFHGRYYHMVLIALFYRAVLLDFSERSALLSRRLMQDQQRRRLSVESINLVNDLRTEFLHFCSYWHFNDVSAKQGDNDAFRRLCAEYKIEEMKGVLASELRHMGEFVDNYYQLRNTDAVNRLAILSLIFGGGAVLTGFFGMNFSREFGAIIFEGEGVTTGVHYFLIAVVTTFVLISLTLGTFVIFRNWREYLSILNPPSPKDSGSIKRGS